MNKKKLIGSIVVGILFIIIIFSFYTTFSLGDTHSFESVVYQIGEGKIEGISPYTDITLFMDYFDVENCKVRVVNSNNETITSGYVMNGSTTILEDNNGKVIATYQNVILGDYDQNGMVDNGDYEVIGRNLIDGGFDEKLFSSIDVNSDQEVHLNDLILLDKTVNMEYQELTLKKSSLVLQSNELGRVGYHIVPSYGKNTNLKWSSNAPNIVNVRQSGVMIGGQEGEAVVRAETMDGKLFQEISVKVDNTIQLESYKGTIYVGGKEHAIFIKSIDYEGITCSSSNERAVSCRIDGKYLMLQGNVDGDAVVTVSSPLYGSAEYQAQAFSTYVNLFPSYGCMGTNRTGSVIISTMLAGELKFEIADQDIIKNVYVEGNRFYMTSGDKAGRGEVVVRATNGAGNKKFTLDVYKLDIPSIGGLGKIGVEMEADIVAEGTETLSCVSQNPEIATCRVDNENKKLYVMPLQLGQVLIEVYNTVVFNGDTNTCGKETFLAVIQE